MILRTILNAISGIIAFAIVSFIIGIPVFYIWNVFIPDVFTLPMITYMQAAGFAALSQLLIKPVNFKIIEESDES